MYIIRYSTPSEILGGRGEDSEARGGEGGFSKFGEYLYIYISPHAVIGHVIIFYT